MKNSYFYRDENFENEGSSECSIFENCIFKKSCSFAKSNFKNCTFEEKCSFDRCNLESCIFNKKDECDFKLSNVYETEEREDRLELHEENEA